MATVRTRLGIDQESGTEGPSERKDPAGLFACPECEKTYVSRTMETCPSCNVNVERVPNERDLGIV